MDTSNQELIEQEAKSTISQGDLHLSHRNKQKIKTSIYLTKEAEIAFTELYIQRLRKNRKVDKSSIVCEALLALYAKDCHQL